MGASLRALRALVLLAGFYLLSVVLLVLLGLLYWGAGLWLSGAIMGKLLIGLVVLAIPVLRGLFMLRTPKVDGTRGVPVTEAREPVLWRTVHEIAAEVGTRAPDEILLVEDVNAAVSEDARLLGLRPGTRRLVIGLPLMAGLDEWELRAVLAHEMGHYANLDTRLTPLIVRGQSQLRRTIGHFHDRADRTESRERVRQEERAARRTAKGKKAKEIDTDGEGLSYRIMAGVYTRYAKFYMRATLSASRRQEFAADLAAVRVAGRDATASALRELNVLDPAHSFYMRCYATVGLDAGLMPLPGQVFGGLRHLLEARAEELDARRSELPTEPTDPYDSHPALADRVARVEALPDDGLASRTALPSLALLADADAAMAALEPLVLTPAALALRRLDWADLVHESMTHRVARGTESFREALTAEGVIAPPPTDEEAPAPDSAAPDTNAPHAPSAPAPARPADALPALLDAFDADPGVRGRLTNRFPRSEDAAAATGRAAREISRAVLREALDELVGAELMARGTIRWQLSWSEPTTLRYPADDFEERLESALDAAVADSCDTAPLRKLVFAP
ncbi:M48 family metalloprotease [Streptomyces sp. NPDC101733]|uniref:M48 family metalloprotease n=1 Tax=unclassified Streptomyces TaxID=2593676 RepID=UPI00380F5F37